MTLPAGLVMATLAVAWVGFSARLAAAQQEPGLKDRVSNFFFGPPAPLQPGQAAKPPEDLPDCPTIDVRQGASTLPVYGSGEAAATNLRYQATIAQMARECAFGDATLTIKVGVQGRILLGPAGGPGQLDVPLRMALVHEGPEPRTLWTKLQKIRVNVPPGQTNVTFTHVEEGISVPKPRGADIDNYIIYVGFDQADVKTRPAKTAGKEFKERPLPSEGQQRGRSRRRDAR
jgi:hypothetical protein